MNSIKIEHHQTPSKIEYVNYFDNPKIHYIDFISHPYQQINILRQDFITEKQTIFKVSSLRLLLCVDPLNGNDIESFFVSLKAKNKENQNQFRVYIHSNNLESPTLSSCGLKSLFKTLNLTQMIRSLHLSWPNSLNFKEANTLVSLLKTNNSIEKLDFAISSTERTIKGLGSNLSSSLKKNRILTFLNIFYLNEYALHTSSRLEKEEEDELIKACEDNQSLLEFNFYDSLNEGIAPFLRRNKKHTGYGPKKDIHEFFPFDPTMMPSRGDDTMIYRHLSEKQVHDHIKTLKKTIKRIDIISCGFMNPKEPTLPV